MASDLVLPADFLAYSLLSAYCLCGCVMEHFAIFRGWRTVHDTRQLKALHSVTGYGALYTYVVPKIALTVFIGYMATHPPLVTERQGLLNSSLWFSSAMMAISWGSSFLVQVPLQLRIQRMPDQQLVKRLVDTTWVRTVPMILHCCSVFYILAAGPFWK
jgi:hypothetical protein